MNTVNGYISQFSGPFVIGENIFSKDQITAKKIGIIADYGTIVEINNKPITISKSEIYEIRGVDVTSIVFQTETDEKTLVDFMIKTSTDKNDNGTVM